jgi:2',3'-cyclic-nucleotide 2'-phosphodiesterase (5'-nucleotidase family)
MKFIQKTTLGLVLILSLVACTTTKKVVPTTTTSTTVEGKPTRVPFEVTFLQLNDVYEIAPLEGGKTGGMARVATLLKTLKAKNPNTFAVLSGDFLNPSVIGTLKYQGKKIKGRQMVEVMNAVPISYVTFGNHEFDLELPDLQERLNESKFTYINSNVHLVKGDIIGRFFQTQGTVNTFLPETSILETTLPSGNTFKIGLFGVCLPSNIKEYTKYDDVNTAAKKAYETLAPQSDVVLGITHLSIEEDKALLATLPNVPLLMGGHEHENAKVPVGNGYITKADANAKTAYVHHILYDEVTKKTTVRSELITIDDSIIEDVEVKATVDKWVTIANESMLKEGFDPNGIVATLKTPLDGRERINRNQQTNMGTLITNAMLGASRLNAKVGLVNSGSIRIDDQVSGSITQTDIIRVMPFGGQLVEVKMKGVLLKQLLDTGESLKGKGGYLQRAGVTQNTDGSWLVGTEKLDITKEYAVITSDFLLSGKERGIEFFTTSNPNILNVTTATAGDKTDLRSDLRKAVIGYLKK